MHEPSPQPLEATQPLSRDARATITYLYTDIEGSTRLWEHASLAMQQSQHQHHAILRQAITSHHGTVFQIRGDAFCASFPTALDGLLAALDAQRALAASQWNETGPLRVRMVVHTGVTDNHAGLHDGPFLNRVGRMLSLAHGGQVLAGASTQALTRELLPPDVSLGDLGEHRLRDVVLPEHIFQLMAPDLPADFPPLQTGIQHPLHLPDQLTHFIGREQELEQLAEVLASARLVTVMGPGGIGKTRLAIQAARQQIEQFPAGAWFVELAPLSDETLVVQAIAQSLGIHEQGGQPLLATLQEYLRGKRLLLVIDNCEHLVAACAQLIGQLLQASPALVALVTSREALDIAGEVLFNVPMLGIPEQHGVNPLEEVAAVDAVRLFVDRAQAVRSDFKLTPQNVAAVIQICRRLDGIPLALELAAARLKLLSVEQIAKRLDDAFRLLASGSRSALPHHQTMRASIDWSYQLLSEEEQLVFARLAVFAGGWVLEAAEQVCAGGDIAEEQVLDILQALVEKSLVVVEERDESVRYRMLVIIQQYANEKLEQAGQNELDLVRGCHLEWCIGLAEAAEPNLEGPEQQEWLQRLEAELDNLRAALAWAQTHAPERGLRLLAALHIFWFARGYFVEARTWYRQMLAVTGQLRTHDRALVTDFFGHHMLMGGDLQLGEQLSQESLELNRELGDKRGVASTLVNLALLYQMQGQMPGQMQEKYAQAITMLEESLALRREAGDTNEIAHALANLARLNCVIGNAAQGMSYGVEALRLYQEVGNLLGASRAMMCIGMSAIKLNENDQAHAYFREGLLTAQQFGNHVGIPGLIFGLGLVAAKTSHWGRAVQLLGFAYKNIKLNKTEGQFNFGVLYEEYLPLLQAQLSPEELTAIRSKGEAMNVEEAVAFALSDEDLE